SLDASGPPKLTPVAKHWPASVLTTRLVGQISVGASVSFTVTVCAQLRLLPFPTRRSSDLVVTPLGYCVGALLVTVRIPQLSLVASGAPKLTPVAKHWPVSVLTTRLVGQISVGASVSFTVTVCAQVRRLPLVSTAVQVTVVT